MRCSVCRHVFVLGSDAAQSRFDDPAPGPAHDEPAPVPGPAPQGSQPPPPDDEFGSIFEEIANGSDDISLSDHSEPPPSEEDILGLSDGEDLSFDLDSQPKTKKSKRARSKGAGQDAKRKSSPVLLLFLLLLAAAGAGSYLYWDEIKAYLPFLSPEDAPEEVETPPDLPQPDLPYQFSFSQDLNHFFMDNTKVGRIFVIQGMVINDYDVPKEFIKLEAQLLDEQGQVLASKSQIIGNTVTYYQLEMLSEEDLEDAINHQMGITSHNINVQPGGEVPFVIVFYNPPEEQVNEFVLRVVEAKDPPQ